MKITSLDRLAAFGRRHPDAKHALASWATATCNVAWRNLAETRQTYPHADAVKVANNRTVTVFNIRGNRYRLLTAIDYPMGAVNILAVLTHAEYDKEKWKETL